jgi:predicted acylesterase/phospholipase RssA
MALLVQGCASLPERNPLPEEYYAEAQVLGLSGLRFWGDDDLPIAKDLSDDPTLEELQAVFPGLVGRELRFLAISGGGENGAFGAGLLNGWTAAGTRPQFNVVTGISTGALIAPFAYLGPAYDHILERFYTQYSTGDLIEKRGWLKSLRTDAAFDVDLLRSLLAEFVDEAVMEAIAAEYRLGRLLLIGTTNIDAARPVTWDIGAIAISGKPGALDLIHDVITASVSIPVVFPPVLIEVEADGRIYDELHVDGGVSRQSFLFHLSAEEDAFQRLNIVGKGQAYVIRNSKLESTWKAVDRKIFSLGGRSASAMVRSQGIGDLYREYLGALKYDFDFNLAYIPSDFEADNHELFDQDYMRRLYKLGHEMASEGYPWEKSPPGLKPL